MSIFRAGDESEIAIKRSLFDDLLMSRAQELGAEVREDDDGQRDRKNFGSIGRSTPASKQSKHEFWSQPMAATQPSPAFAICFRAPARERIALQSHVPLPQDFGDRVVLQFLPEGYSGQAPVSDRELNLCLVGVPASISSLRKWAERNFGIATDHPWRTITPLTRAPFRLRTTNLFLIGDAARVVEPFTGEGIYYALRGGELAAAAIAKIIRGQDRQSALRQFSQAHTRDVSRQIVDQPAARAAVLSPRFASLVLRAARFQPSILRLLTAKIVRPN